jgi:hypothetical protein
MPPQQHDRLLDLIDDILDFRAHDDFHWGRREAATLNRKELAIRQAQFNRQPDQ